MCEFIITYKYAIIGVVMVVVGTWWNIKNGYLSLPKRKR